MHEKARTIDPERLMQAVDAIYRAEREFARQGGYPRLPSELIGTDRQPAAFAGFGREEIAEATKFLARMNLLHFRPADDRRAGQMPAG